MPPATGERGWRRTCAMTCVSCGLLNGDGVKAFGRPLAVKHLRRVCVRCARIDADNPQVVTMPLSLKQLENFVAVAETGSIRAAARGLRVSQPAITKSVRSLE